jgi:hypothetical protein
VEVEEMVRGKPLSPRSRLNSSTLRREAKRGPAFIFIIRHFNDYATPLFEHSSVISPLLAFNGWRRFHIDHQLKVIERKAR